MMKKQAARAARHADIAAGGRAHGLDVAVRRCGGVRAAESPGSSAGSLIGFGRVRRVCVCLFDQDRRRWMDMPIPVARKSLRLCLSLSTCRFAHVPIYLASCLLGLWPTCKITSTIHTRTRSLSC